MKRDLSTFEKLVLAVLAGIEALLCPQGECWRKMGVRRGR